MNKLLGPFRELVARRLWPVAILLILAAVAVPKLLADDAAAPATRVAAVPADGADPLNDTPLVAISGSETGARRVLGARKDPFAPTGDQSRPKAETASAPDTGSTPDGEAAAQAGDDSKSSGDTGAGAGGSGSTGGAPAAPAVPTPPAGDPAPETPPEKFELYSLKVRFDEQERKLERLAPLPDDETPSIIYLGLLEDEKTAVFLLDDTVTAEGDGTCHPTPEDCQRLYLKKGETEFFTVAAGDEGGEAEHQLDLISITTKKAKSAKAATAARAATSSAGRRALRAQVDRTGRLRFDPRTGTLRRISVEQWRAAVAARARSAR